MQVVTKIDELNELISAQPGLVVLFGGEHCNVCNVIKPKLEEMLGEAYPNLVQVYVDCQKSMDVCSQNSIFSLPVVRVYLDGQMFLERARSFSLQEVIQEIARPYGMMFD